MARSKGKIPFTAAWKARYKEKLHPDKLSDALLIDKEVKHRKEMYQISISAGFWIGSHIGVAIVSHGVTIPASVVQLAWQTYRILEIGCKHKMVLAEVYGRGLEPRDMTKAEMAKTAAFAALSIAISQAIDNIGSHAVEDSVSSGGGGFADQAHGALQAAMDNPGQAISEGVAKGGAVSLSLAIDALALAVGTSAVVAKGAAAISKSSHSHSWTCSSARQSNTSSGITIRAQCQVCSDYFSTVLGGTLTCNSCQFKKLRGENQRTCLVESETKDTGTLHLDSFCDGCCSGIMGSRFKCSCCPDFDLTPVVLRRQCEECYLSDEYTHHTDRHSFIELQGSESGSELIFIDFCLAVHEDVYCDGCSSDLVGSRNKCTICPYFDLCQDCYMGKAGRDHDPSHVFELVSTY